MPVTPDAVLRVLSALPGPDGATPVPRAGRLSAIDVRDGRVAFAIEIDPAMAAAWEPVRRSVERAVGGLAGVAGVLVTLTAERAATSGTVGGATGAKIGGAQPGADARGAAAVARFPSLANVRRIVAVASGKGGVGKSTTAVNLALALSGLGLKVGVLDADIYGPSMPKLLALKGQPRVIEGRTLAPMEGYGCKVMSIGFVVDAGKAMVWRGPMVASAITQMLRDVAWGALDVLVVDMPPGTGDAQLTMAQQVPLAGAVVVSTPQDLALIDARRGVAMFRDVGVAILGIVENMSYFVCDGCGKRHHIFAHGGARAEAEGLGVPFLGEIALDPLIRERSDAGLPIVVTEPESEGARAYRGIAEQVRAALGLERP